MRLKRTSITLDTDVLGLLVEIRELTGAASSEIIRRAVRHYAAIAGGVESDVPMLSLPLRRKKTTQTSVEV